MGSLAGSGGVLDGRTRTSTDEHGRTGEGAWCFAGRSFHLLAFVPGLERWKRQKNLKRSPRTARMRKRPLL